MDIYTVENDFLNFYDNLCSLNLKSNIKALQEFLIKKLEIIEDFEQKKLYVLISDEFLVQKIGRKWIDYLLELYFFKTCNGGKEFFDDFKRFAEKQNLQMVKLYGISFNILFYKHQQENNEFTTIIKRFFTREDSIKSTIPYRNMKRKIYINSLFFIFIPIVLVIIFVNSYEMTSIIFKGKKALKILNQ